MLPLALVCGSACTGRSLCNAGRWRPSGITWPWASGRSVLVVRNAYLFTTKIYEDMDFAANTIAVLQAKRFDLLTGN